MSLRNTALGISCVLLLVGCGAELLTTTVITTQLQAQSASTAANALNQAKEQTALISVQQGIKTFQAYEGRNPQSLEELQQKGYLASLPQTSPGKALYYDPSTGSVWIGQVTPVQGQAAPQQVQRQQQGGGMVYMSPTGQMIQGPQYGGGTPSYPQGMARGVTENYSQRQMDAVKELGY